MFLGAGGATGLPLYCCLSAAAQTLFLAFLRCKGWGFLVRWGLGFGARTDLFWLVGVDFRRGADFVRWLSCFRLDRRVHLGINMVSINNCGFAGFTPVGAVAGQPGRGQSDRPGLGGWGRSWR